MKRTKNASHHSNSYSSRTTHRETIDWKVLTNGFLTKSVDACLWSLFFVFDLAQRKSAYEAMAGQTPIADSIVQYFRDRRMKAALQNARRSDYIRMSGVKGKAASITITKTGFARLRALVPHYDHKRTWDEVMHLVTYDIPEQQRHFRDTLRDQLKKWGAVGLQKSVWLTPYNPITMLRELAKQHALAGSIIVSTLGKDGTIGGKNMQELLVQVYQLQQLNRRYANFMHNWKNKHIDSFAVGQFLAILRDDPQLPFELLPDWWLGDSAYKKVAHLLQKCDVIYASE